MENNPLLLKICRLFPSSLANSCHIRTLSDVAHHHHHHQPCPNNLSSTSSSSTLNPSPPTHVKHRPNTRRNPTSSTATAMPMASHVSSSSNGGGDGDAQSDPVSGQNSFRRNRKKTGLRSDDGVSTQLYYCSRNRRRRRSRRWGLEAAGEESYGWYAVEKRTKDPRREFRASMVEMIVEKQMVAPEDLQRLLLGFLALNSDSYHGMILQVFSEICETLFANY